jgi:hypothetical protein
VLIVTFLAKHLNNNSQLIQHQHVLTFKSCCIVAKSKLCTTNKYPHCVLTTIVLLSCVSRMRCSPKQLNIFSGTSDYNSQVVLNQFINTSPTSPPLICHDSTLLSNDDVMIKLCSLTNSTFFTHDVCPTSVRTHSCRRI